MKIARGILTIISLICALALIPLTFEIIPPGEGFGPDNPAILRFAGVWAVLALSCILNSRLYYGKWQLWPPSWGSCTEMSENSTRYLRITGGLGIAAILVFLILRLVPLSTSVKLIVLLVGFVLFALVSIVSLLFFESILKDLKKPDAGPRDTPDSVSGNVPGAGPDPGPGPICNPWYAAIFSGIVPGWGQWYTGRTLAGFAFSQGFFLLMFLIIAARIPTTRLHPFESLLTILLTVIFLGFWIYGMYDAYQSAQKINRGELAFSGKSLLFWFPAIAVFFLLAWILLILVAVAGVVISGAVNPGTGISGNGYADMNVSATALQTDADHIVVTMQNVPDPDQIFEVYAKVTDDNGTTQTKVLGLDYRDVEKGSSMKFSGAYAGSNHVTATVLFDSNHTPITILDSNI
ncbi:MAG: hypothetical protein LUQ35_05155 [Methanoregula sp.]|nr:hypothetical protein [Methanoregula sp.]